MAPKKQGSRLGGNTGAELTVKQVHVLADYLTDLGQRLETVGKLMDEQGKPRIRVRTFSMATSRIDYLVQMVLDAEKATEKSVVERLELAGNGMI